MSKPKPKKSVDSLRHDADKRLNIPTQEYQSVMPKEDLEPIRVAYQRRNRDLDPQLVWRGKDEQDESDLVVPAHPLYIQEKIHPKALIKDLIDISETGAEVESLQASLFADFNGIPEGADKTDFYTHPSNWSNRMILGDSLQVMASLAEREGLRGQVQCIYIDPPYGIKFNSNFQWSTTSRDVKDGKAEHITREPEMVKAFRDTWRDGIHTYLGYLRDRLEVARDLLADTGSIFVQIGDENVHRVRALMDEVLGEENFVSQITIKTTGGLGSSGLKGVSDYILWYARDISHIKFRKPLLSKVQGEGHSTGERYSEVYEPKTGTFRTLTKEERNDAQTIPPDVETFQYDNLVSSGYTPTCTFPIVFEGREFNPGGGRSWKTNEPGIKRLAIAGRIGCTGKSIRYRRFLSDYPGYEANNIWLDIAVRTDKQYVVETAVGAIQRCLLMTSDPGDLVLDPTCGSGTTAYVAEQWGRRWITIDTSRVALALARARLMGARYPYYLLADSPEGQQKEAEITRKPVSAKSTFGNLRHGFVYERVPHITLRSIANNAEIDVIWERYEPEIQRALATMNSFRPDKQWNDWEVPRPPYDRSETPDPEMRAFCEAFDRFWELRIERQREIDKSIAAKADFEYLYDKPYEDKKKVRVAGPFTVESLSPFRSLVVDDHDNLVDPLMQDQAGKLERQNFAAMILENLRTAGVQQVHKEDKIEFSSVAPWPGRYISGEGMYQEGETHKRAGIFIGPEFGTVSRQDLVEAAKEAGDADFDVVVACAFNFDAPSSEFHKLGRIPVLKARMNADLHMGSEFKNTGKGNLFVIFGEPDIDVLPAAEGHVKVKINGVDIFDPSTGEVRSHNADGIACWFIDTDYNGESFYVRHAYFLGANDPYKSLKTTLRTEIDEEAWESLNSDVSRAFEKPATGRIAVKVINHLGDEVMKVFEVK